MTNDFTVKLFQPKSIDWLINFLPFAENTLIINADIIDFPIYYTGNVHLTSKKVTILDNICIKGKLIIDGKVLINLDKSKKITTLGGIEAKKLVVKNAEIYSTIKADNLIMITGNIYDSIEISKIMNYSGVLWEHVETDYYCHTVNSMVMKTLYNKDILLHFYPMPADILNC